MTRRKQKQHILFLLREKPYQEILRSVGTMPAAEVINPLFSALCSPHEIVRWHAISCFGLVVRRIGDGDLEAARIIMRRLLWSLNDESGGIGWGAPEAMAEIMAQDERLAHEYLHMLISYMRDDGPELFQDGNFLELPMLQRGLLWGVGRLARVRNGQMRSQSIEDDLPQYFDSEDPVVRGLAIWVVLGLEVPPSGGLASHLYKDSSRLSIYWEGTCQQTTVAELAHHCHLVFDLPAER